MLNSNYLITRVRALDSCFLQIVLNGNNILNDKQNWINNTRILQKILQNNILMFHN